MEQTTRGRRSDSHNPSQEVSRALTPVVPVSSSSSSKFWMYERCFRLVKSARTEEYECLLTRTSLTKHERTVKIGKDKKRLKEHVLAHHTGLDLSSLEGTPSNPGAVKKVDALIGEYNRDDASSVANFFERTPQPTNTPERDFALWVMACCKSLILPAPRSFV